MRFIEGATMTRKKDKKLSKVFSAVLHPGEKLLWTGQPDVSVHFCTQDILLIPYSLSSAIVMAIWMGGVSYAINASPDPVRIVAMIMFLVGIPMFVYSMFAVFGRFIYKAWNKSCLYYAITDKRAIILNKNGALQEVVLDQIASITLIPGMHKTGTIKFGNCSQELSRAELYANTGLDFLSVLGLNVFRPSFFDVPDVDKVYGIINELRGRELAAGVIESNSGSGTRTVTKSRSSAVSSSALRMAGKMRA